MNYDSYLILLYIKVTNFVLQFKNVIKSSDVCYKFTI